MRHPLVRLVAVAMALALFGACSSSGSNGTADTTVPTAPPQTTTTAAADPFAIPDVIDEAYVNRVLAALDQIDGDVLRSVVANGGINPEVPTMLRAIYNDPQYEIELEGLRALLARGLDNFKSPPGNRKTLVARLITARRDCIFLEATTEFDEVLKDEPPDVPDEVEIFTLRPTQPDADPSSLNPTSWSIVNAEVIKRADSPKKRARCDA